MSPGPGGEDTGIRAGLFRVHTVDYVSVWQRPACSGPGVAVCDPGCPKNKLSALVLKRINETKWQAKNELQAG